MTHHFNCYEINEKKNKNFAGDDLKPLQNPTAVYAILKRFSIWRRKKLEKRERRKHFYTFDTKINCEHFFFVSYFLGILTTTNKILSKNRSFNGRVVRHCGFDESVLKAFVDWGIKICFMIFNQDSWMSDRLLVRQP